MAGPRETRLHAPASISTSTFSHEQSSQSSLRSPWNLSTNLESKSNLSKDQQSRASWMMSTWSHAPSCSLSTSSPRVSNSSTNHNETVPGEMEGLAKAGTSRKQEPRPRNSFATSLSEPNGTVPDTRQCPRNPSLEAKTASTVACGSRKRTEAAAATQAFVKLGVPSEADRPSSESSAFTHAQAAAAACIASSAATYNPSKLAYAQQWAGALPEDWHDWLARLEQLICSPPSIDLVPLRRKHARLHSLGSRIPQP